MKAERLAEIAFTIGLLIQIGIWGNAVIAFWLSRLVKKRIEKDAASATTLSALGFAGKLILWAGVNVSPIMLFPVQIKVDDEAAGGSDHGSFIFDADLAFSKDAQLALDLFPRPRFHAGETFVLDPHQLIIVLHANRSNVNLLFKGFQIFF